MEGAYHSYLRVRCVDYCFDGDGCGWWILGQKVDVILFLKQFICSTVRMYRYYKAMEIHYPRIGRKSKFKVLVEQNVSSSVGQY